MFDLQPLRVQASRWRQIGRGILSDRGLRVAVRARTGGGYTYQIFTISSEPRTVPSPKMGRSYASPVEAAEAGFEALAMLKCIDYDLI